MLQSGSPISVVIAEDDALLRHFLVRQLADQDGFTVLGSAGSGREAVEMVSRSRPRVLLLDLELPEISGLEVLERLAGMENRPDVLVLSGQELEDTQHEAACRGASGFLPKSQA